MAVGPAANTRAARPTVHEVLRSVLLRAVLPALVMFGLLLGIGKALMTVFHEVPSEERISQKVAAERDGVLNTVTKVVSTINDTWFTIGGAIVIGLALLALTRKWWLSVVPLLAISLEASVFVPVTHLVGRPRPEVGRLDNAPPTSSFPSGHTAASFALFWSLAMLATRIENSALRRTVQTLCVLFPFGVGAARLYRGMHHFSDIVFGPPWHRVRVRGLPCCSSGGSPCHRTSGGSGEADDGLKREPKVSNLGRIAVLGRVVQVVTDRKAGPRKILGSLFDARSISLPSR
ncbi:phosphatase PAP2 family protein [Dermacoccus sp. PE3]|uniref:phosphatase PAP2 family protein n=1 Tax=Dermacoccus sp. PE3 TaxID=1641401 RepID=UPI00069B3645|nr:phosphatase PAP2 family protein [Dermacoccus sp. PE3]